MNGQKVKRFLLLLFSTFILVEICPANTPNGNIEFEILHNRKRRYYEVHLPQNYDSTLTYPLVIALHGERANAKHMQKITGLSDKADESGFIVVYPQGSGRFRKNVLTWNAANCCGYAYDEDVDDVGFIEIMISNLEALYRIDPKRIFVTGFSNGGMMAFKLACNLAKKIAAIAPVAAAFNDLSCEPDAPVSVVIFHGSRDREVPIDGGIGKEPTATRMDNSVASAITFWVQHNGCNIESNIEVIDKVTREDFIDGKKGSAVTLYLVRTGWHAWPGGKATYLFPAPPYPGISATDLIWDFFSKHPKKH